MMEDKLSTLPTKHASIIRLQFYINTVINPNLSFILVTYISLSCLYKLHSLTEILVPTLQYYCRYLKLENFVYGLFSPCQCYIYT